jgi:flagellar basal-body rod modification protein FlgD
MTDTSAVNPALSGLPPGLLTQNASTTTGTNGSTQLSLNTGLTSLATNFQSYMTLLTTQLKNQDPLSPLDTNQFTQQITQMTGVEQQLLSNQLLQTLVNEQGGLSSAANLIGKQITAPGATTADPPITGVVTAVQTVNGQTVLTVGSNQVPLNAVTGISQNSSNPLAALLGG